MTINGKITYPMIAGAVAVVMWLAGLSAGVNANDADIAELKAVPLKIVRIETVIENIETDISEIKAEQIEQRKTLDKILYAVSGAEHDD